jgi:hypothetical protein
MVLRIKSLTGNDVTDVTDLKRYIVMNDELKLSWRNRISRFPSDKVQALKTKPTLPLIPAFSPKEKELTITALLESLGFVAYWSVHFRSLGLAWRATQVQGCGFKVQGWEPNRPGRCSLKLR